MMASKYIFETFAEQSLVPYYYSTKITQYTFIYADFTDEIVVFNSYSVRIYITINTKRKRVVYTKSIVKV